MSRSYRIELKVYPAAPTPGVEDYIILDELAAAVSSLWRFDTWDTEPDGSYWASGEDLLSGHENGIAGKLAIAVAAVLPGARVAVVATDIDSAPSTTITFGPGGTPL